MTPEDKIIQTVQEEARRIRYGTIVMHVKVRDGKLVNVQHETCRSVQLERS